MSEGITSRLRARADRVNQACDLGDLLGEYGYNVVSDPHREQQFACTLHGRDGKPSARYYPVSNSTYCWVCHKHRDPIAYVMEHEGLEFVEAIRMLEEKLALGPLPWDDDDGRSLGAPRTEMDKIEAMRRPGISFESAKERLQKLLESLTRDRDLDAPALLLFWEVFDRIEHQVSSKAWDDGKAVAALERLREHVFEKLNRDLRGG